MRYVLTVDAPSNPLIFLAGSLVMIAIGVMMFRNRDAIASKNGDLLRGLGGKPGEREARRSTPTQFALAGIALTMGGTVALIITLIAIFGGSS